jgi:hypothetical protein
MTRPPLERALEIEKTPPLFITPPPSAVRSAGRADARRRTRYKRRSSAVGPRQPTIIQTLLYARGNAGGWKAVAAAVGRANAARHPPARPGRLGPPGGDAGEGDRRPPGIAIYPTPRTIIERTRADPPMAARPAAGTADRSRPVERQLVAGLSGGPPRPARSRRRREADRGPPGVSRAGRLNIGGRRITWWRVTTWRRRPWPCSGRGNRLRHPVLTCCPGTRWATSCGRKGWTGAAPWTGSHAWPGGSEHRCLSRRGASGGGRTRPRA